MGSVFGKCRILTQKHVHHCSTTFPPKRKGSGLWSKSIFCAMLLRLWVDTHNCTIGGALLCPFRSYPYPEPILILPVPISTSTQKFYDRFKFYFFCCCFFLQIFPPSQTRMYPWKPLYLSIFQHIPSNASVVSMYENNNEKLERSMSLC